MKILKSTGLTDTFDEKKLHLSLAKAGVPEADIPEIINEVSRGVKENMKSTEIFKKSCSLLGKRSKQWAGRYRLKRAILELGPSGFNFEQLVSKLFQRKAYETRTNLIMTGQCIDHEVDVRAENEDEIILVECKFHNHPGYRSDVRTALYIYSRFEDIKDNPKNSSQKYHRGAIFTNTRFTQDAVKYGQCKGLRLIGWGSPSDENLQQLLESAFLYPITCLPVLSNWEKKALLDSGLLLCSDIRRESQLLKAGIKTKRIRGILQEARKLSGPYYS